MAAHVDSMAPQIELDPVSGRHPLILGGRTEGADHLEDCQIAAQKAGQNTPAAFLGQIVPQIHHQDHPLRDGIGTHQQEQTCGNQQQGHHQENNCCQPP
jgi:hypothetical protein